MGAKLEVMLDWRITPYMMIPLHMLMFWVLGLALELHTQTDLHRIIETTHTIFHAEFIVSSSAGFLTLSCLVLNNAVEKC